MAGQDARKNLHSAKDKVQSALTCAQVSAILNLRNTKGGEYMYRVNAPKIRGKMSEKGYTIASLAQGIGVNRNTLAAYLEHPEKIPFGKLLMMADLLCDTPCEAALIFFNQDLRKTKVVKN
jgi:hypothetical protein